MGERGNSVPGLCGAGVKSGSRLKKKKMRENFSREEKEEAESKPLLSLFIKQGGMLHEWSVGAHDQIKLVFVVFLFLIHNSKLYLVFLLHVNFKFDNSFFWIFLKSHPSI
jgi:hypothetical protein